MQNFSAPVHSAWLNRSTPVGILDFAVAALFLLLLAGETKADEEMWIFQKDKKARLENAEDMSRRSPFYREGMYSFCRHPNYFCEVISIYIYIYIYIYIFRISKLNNKFNLK